VKENPWGYKEDRWKVPILFESKTLIAPDTYKLRFKFEDPNRVLGTKLGQNTKLHIDLGEDNEISRFYTPISAVDQKGIVEFVLKEIKDINTLSMSQMLSKLNAGHKIFLSGPYSLLVYNGGGSFEILKKGALQPKQVKNVGIIAEGSGMGAFFQIIRAVSTEKTKNVKASFLFINPTPKDIFFEKELDDFASLGHTKVSYLIQRDYENFKKGPTGPVTKELITSLMPKAGPDSLVCVCGQRANKELAIKFLKESGYDDSMIYV
jgi:cytochrome-b5 reductase